MSRIKGTNTKPEMLLRKRLFAEGFRYRINDKKLPGRPDIVLKKYRTVIFVNGCFWHGHENCKYFVIPKTRSDFWMTKIRNTVERDAKHNELLINNGWNVITVWECDLEIKTFDNTIQDIKSKLQDLLPYIL